MPSPYTEHTLIEAPAIALFAELGWQTVDANKDWVSGTSSLGRETKSDVVLVERLRAALRLLNPDASHEAVEQAIEELARERAALSPAHAAQEVWRLLAHGVKVRARDERGEQLDLTLRVIDWDAPQRNDFLLAAQMTITGDLYTCRPDLLGFVNGLPLVLAELKATHVPAREAFDGNVSHYKAAIPQLFPYVAAIVVSNGSESRVGTSTAAWEHFGEWKRINSEGEQGVVSLETLVRGVCAPERLLDIVENFTIFSDAHGGLARVLGMNHQVLGVNNAFAALQELGENRGRLGVFWHTQGSGKSYSMIFFSQKALRKLGGWTFVIVTDRQELDEQIYKNFASSGVVTEQQVQAESGEHLRQLLREDHRHVFTLIQKFHTPPGTPFPVLSERADIVVITDEALRSQYDTFALNMRRALPNAAFIGFTGTPLLVGEEKTREVFGDYVSIYNFRQSIEDGATTPLYYENRIPELQLTNADLNADLEALLEAAALTPEQDKKLEREFRREYHLITRDDRLETIAEDIVRHFVGRGFPGKAMVVSIDKATAVRMYDKVRKHWQAELERRVAALQRIGEDRPHERREAEQVVALMRETDMAVVVSPAQNEAAEFKKKGLDITPHRRRMVREDMAKKFKNAEDPIRLVFVCAMWMTGFDVPSLSTIYLDKPMRNHTLMQTIARANRVYAGKTNGLIVDYAGVFRDLQNALAIYGSDAGGAAASGESPVQDKAALVARLAEVLAEARAFLAAHSVDCGAALAAEGFAKVAALDRAVEALLVSDDVKAETIARTNAVVALFKAILPDPAAEQFRPQVALLSEIVRKLRALAEPVDISAVLGEVERLLDASIAAEGYVIHDPGEPYDTRQLIDLSQIDFEALRKLIEQGKRRTAAEVLRGAIGRTLTRMVEQNATRIDYLKQFQELIDAYNAGALNVELFFARLQAFVEALNAEQERAIAENLSEEDLAIFDLLTRPDPGLTPAETTQVKKVARDLLATLKREKLTLDWRKRQQARADVLVSIQQLLDDGLPRAYSPADYQERCTAIYQHVYDHYIGTGATVYDAA